MVKQLYPVRDYTTRHIFVVDFTILHCIFENAVPSSDALYM